MDNHDFIGNFLWFYNHKCYVRQRKNAIKGFSKNRFEKGKLAGCVVN